MDAPSMVHRSGDTLIVRSVVSGNQLYLDQEADQLLGEDYDDKIPTPVHGDSYTDYDASPNRNLDANGDEELAGTSGSLPQCKIKRNYSCNSCTYFTQNPRFFLTHLKEVHGEKIIINACKHCLYASRHYQKLVRHMKMVHGSTDGLEEQALSRKRASQMAREMKKRKSSLDELQQQHQMQQQQQIQLQIQRQYQMQHNQAMQQELDAMESHSVDSYGSSPEPPEPMVSIGSFLPETGSSSPDNNKLLKCTVCDYSTYWRIQLADHERDVHNKTKFFRCEKCSYVTHIKARFSKHVKYHSMPMIKCVMCDFRTPYKWNLDRHMKNHGGAGLYKCSACNFTADIKQSLTVHEMNHHVPPVGHASGMSMARRKNKVGGTDIVDQFLPNNLNDPVGHSLFGTDLTMGNLNNNNNSGMDSFNEPLLKKIKLEAPADLSITRTTDAPKKISRPVPNLIPIQNQSPPPSSSATTSNGAINLSMPNRSFMPNLAGSSPTLKDLTSYLIQKNQNHAEIIRSQLSPTSNNTSASMSNLPRRKPSNFFDKFLRTGREVSNLVCDCGHVAKCLSERIIHQKHCKSTETVSTPVNLTFSGATTGSTRCQLCRHRCKTSADLFLHMQHCSEATTNTSNGGSIGSCSNFGGSNDKMDISGEDCIDEEQEDCEDGDDESETDPHPMENRVFVWNNQVAGRSSVASGSSTATTSRKRDDRSEDNNSEHDDISYYGVETAPGYGEVTKKLHVGEDDEATASASLKKVFKCPHCSFWASTASRFHVHIVGHLNKKPFECSLCSYRSNWRWDITKHIRLKTIRDPSHKNARVLMNDETGRRNYTKYNKHITLMKVTEEDGDPKLLKSGEMTPSQEAALSFMGHSSSDSQPRESTTANRDGRGNGPESSADGYDSSEAPLSLVKPGIRDDEGRQPSPARIPTNHTAEHPLPPPPETNKKTSFKCKRCQFRHSNRDVVLTHVKNHYHEAGLLLNIKPIAQSTPEKSLEPPMVPVNPLLLPAVLNHIPPASGVVSFHLQSSSPIKVPTPPQCEATDMSFNPYASQPPQNSPTISMKPVSMLMASPPQPSPISMTGLNLSNSPSSALTSTQSNALLLSKQQPQQQSTTIENGEMDEASSLGSSVTGWRDPAPYRCGHCHQNSNWKHVIQRHCRLKHNGDINIELIEKGSKTGVYVRLFIPGSSGLEKDVTADGGEKVPTVGSSSAPSSSSSGKEVPSIIIDDGKEQSKEGIEVHEEVVESKHPQIRPSQQNQLIQLLNQKPKHFECTKCPFSSPCRVQLDQHLSKQHSLNPVASTSSQQQSSIIDLDELDLDEAICASRVSHQTDNASNNPSQPKAGSSLTTMERQLKRIHETRQKSRQSEMQLPRVENNPLQSRSKLSTERCPHCPYKANTSEKLQKHMQNHVCVSNVENLVTCDHCDYSVADDRALRDHVRLHFDDGTTDDDEASNDSSPKPVTTRSRSSRATFYTRFDKFVLSTSKPSSSAGSAEPSTSKNSNNNNSKKQNNFNDERIILFPLKPNAQSEESLSESASSDKENKIIVDIRTGEVLSTEPAH